VIFAITLAINVLSKTIEPASLIIKSLLTTWPVAFLTAILFWGNYRRYNRSQFIIFFLIAAYNVSSGALATYLIYTAFLNYYWQSSVLIVTTNLLVSWYFATHLIYPYKAEKMTFCLVLLFSQIIISGLLAWAAIEWWFVYI